MSLYKQGVILYIYIYTHIYKKTAQCVYTAYLYPYIYLCEATGLCVWSLCLLCSHTRQAVGMKSLFIRNWS